MSILTVGTTALDSIKTPYSENPRLLGGSASHAAIAASFFAPVSLLGIVGEDFPEKYLQLYQRHGIDLQGMQRTPGKTFHWEGEYEVNMNNRRTLATELGVIEDWMPTLPDALTRHPYVLLANCAPALQLHVLRQMQSPRFVVADTMDLWLNIAKPDLLELLKKIDCLVLNDSEARLLTDCDNLIKAIPQIHALGPRYVIIKKGEHGAILSGTHGFFLASAFPLENLEDPTGAGDSFVGGLMGYLAEHAGDPDKHLRSAIIHGTVVASFCCEGFGVSRTTAITRADIDKRIQDFHAMTTA